MAQSSVPLVIGALVVLGLGAWLVSREGRENPVGLETAPRRRRLIAKGRNVFVDLSDGREVTLPGTMLHDPEGKAWPRNSVLFGPIARGHRGAPPDDDAQAYFGSGYRAKVGSAKVPPRGLQGWQRVGTVTDIYYTRGGRSHPGRYHHGFGQGMFNHGRVTLYRRGRWWRIQLPRGSVLNARGFVKP